MREIKFFNRENEIKDLKNILKREPRRLYFIYGPINSGKTELVKVIIESLDTHYKVFYINLRGYVLSRYEDFLNVFFEVDEDSSVEKIKDYLKPMSESIANLTKLAGIPISNTIFDKIFEKKEKSKDVFKYLFYIFKEIKNRGYKPILILDELQMLRGLNIDGDLLYELFNFFVRLTKEEKLCNVFCITSDSLFVERIYSTAELQERSYYILIDDFAKNETKEFLEEYGFKEGEIDLIYDYLGGKPTLLIEIIEAKMDNKNISEVLEYMLLDQKQKILFLLSNLKYFKKKINIDEGEFEVNYNLVIDSLKSFKDKEELDANLDEIVKIYLTRQNLLFLDPVRGILKPQSKLVLKAIRAIITELN